MIIVALGLMMDNAYPRPYYENPTDSRPRRALALRNMHLNRSWATLHRRTYRVVARHRRSDRAPEPPVGPSPLRAA